MSNTAIQRCLFTKYDFIVQSGRKLIFIDKDVVVGEIKVFMPTADHLDRAKMLIDNIYNGDCYDIELFNKKRTKRVVFKRYNANDDVDTRISVLFHTGVNPSIIDDAQQRAHIVLRKDRFEQVINDIINDSK